MTSITQVETAMNEILNERANSLAKDTGAIQRVRKFRGADLLQTLVFGWMQHPEASLEMLSSTAAIRAVKVSDTAVHKRFTSACADFLHAVLEEMLLVLVQAEEVTPPKVLRRFAAVVIEDSSTITLPDELASLWQGCGGNQTHTSAALKLHVRWELLHGRLLGPALTDGRCSDHRSPLRQQELPEGSLYVTDLGYFCVQEIAQRHRQHRFTLTRLRVGTKLFDRKRTPLALATVLPQRVGQMKEMRVLVGAQEQVPMRLLMLRVPKDIADKRRQDLLADAQRRQQPVSEETLRLADWTLLITDAPAKRLPFQAALVLLRERWQMELLYKLWKQHAQVDEWRTANPWRALCELYAKLIGVVLQHWLIVLFAWQDSQRSLVKLAHVVRDCAGSLMEALSGERSLLSVLRLIERRMHAGCQMNKRKKHPNSAQLLESGCVQWRLSWCA
jgi:Transposase DDE domain